MTRECHVRFCEGLTGKFRWSTRLALMWFCYAKVFHTHNLQTAVVLNLTQEVRFSHEI